MGSTIFERNYLSRMIRYNTQDAFWGRLTDNESQKAASRIGQLRDHNRPRKLNPRQRQQVLQSPKVLELAAVRDQLSARIEKEYGVVTMAVGELIHRDHQDVGRLLNSTIRAEERAMLKQIQEEYDEIAPVLAIQQQLNGEVSDDEVKTSETEMDQIRLIERRLIAEVALSDPSKFADCKAFSVHIDFAINMIALCKRRERPRPQAQRPQVSTSVQIANNPLHSPKLELHIECNIPLKCESRNKIFQCLFCLAQGLPSDDCTFERKSTLQNHVNRWHLREYGSNDLIPCPDSHACADITLKGNMHFKRHANDKHNFVL
jgi:hypothetical protein